MSEVTGETRGEAQERPPGGSIVGSAFRLGKHRTRPLAFAFAFGNRAGLWAT
jgi:hypothetical protein